jgi:hypothetical protein
MGRSPDDEDELARRLSGLSRSVRRNIAANAGLVSVLGPSAGVPDPTPHRALIRRLLERLESV